MFDGGGAAVVSGFCLSMGRCLLGTKGPASAAVVSITHVIAPRIRPMCKVRQGVGSQTCVDHAASTTKSQSVRVCKARLVSVARKRPGEVACRRPCPMPDVDLHR